MTGISLEKAASPTGPDHVSQIRYGASGLIGVRKYEGRVLKRWKPYAQELGISHPVNPAWEVLPDFVEIGLISQRRLLPIYIDRTQPKRVSDKILTAAYYMERGVEGRKQRLREARRMKEQSYLLQLVAWDLTKAGMTHSEVGALLFPGRPRHRARDAGRGLWRLAKKNVEGYREGLVEEES